MESRSNENAGMERRRFHLSKRTLLIIIAILAVASVATAFAILAFTQHFPVVPVSSVGGLTANCGDSAGSTLNVVGTVTAGTDGNLFFNCPSPNAGVCGTDGGSFCAFAVTNPPVTATPTFSLPSEYTALYLVDSLALCPSSGAVGGILLTSGTAVTITSGIGTPTLGPWFYCASFTAASVGSSTSMPAFDVNWA